MKLKANDKKKLAKKLETNTQGSVILDALKQGLTPSISDLRGLGIADPRRVINALRSNGNTITSSVVKGETVFSR